MRGSCWYSQETHCDSILTSTSSQDRETILAGVASKLLHGLDKKTIPWGDLKEKRPQICQRRAPAWNLQDHLKTAQPKQIRKLPGNIWLQWQTVSLGNVLLPSAVHANSSLKNDLNRVRKIDRWVPEETFKRVSARNQEMAKGKYPEVRKLHPSKRFRCKLHPTWFFQPHSCQWLLHERALRGVLQRSGLP